MKLRKLTALLVAIAMLLGTMPFIASADTVWKTFYVSPNGSDTTGNGTQAKPYKTLARAQEAVRAENAGMQGDIVVSIAGGTYYMDEPLSFRKEDSGKNGHRVIWQGVDRPLISGGKEVTGFVPSQDHPGLYEANVDGVDRIMQIYVNGKKRWMAR
ncbi:MAG: fibronectin type III domain-containing protein, partial [Clostridia bacterium]|nr:fibronectin type III domain-containing protein [Clostridia bacterium]